MSSSAAAAAAAPAAAAAALLPPVHPAVPASAHLIPGIKDWAAHTTNLIASFGLDDYKGALSTLTSLKGLQSWYIHTEPLHSALTFSTALSVLTFVLGELTNNSSTVDRLWAWLPILYSAHFALHPHWAGAGSVTKLFSWSGALSPWQAIVPNGVDERMFLVLILQTLWGIRLTGNTLRRGFFDFRTEDYRWAIVRNKLSHWQYVLLDFFFIAFTQNYLLLAAALPQYLLLTSTRAYHPANPPTPLGWPDAIIAGIFVLNLLVEETADQQQQAFQNWKHGPGMKEGKGARILAGKSQREVEVAEGNLRRGFNTSGLWGWSRHPNFFCEQLNFWILPLFTLRATVPQKVFEHLWASLKTSIDLRNPYYIIEAVKAASPHLFNYSWLISLGMTALFLASTRLTEAISLGKYPKYKEYQRRVGMFSPLTTLLKGAWLAITGQLREVNEQVYGSTKTKDQ